MKNMFLLLGYMIILTTDDIVAADPCSSYLPIYQPNVRGTQCLVHERPTALCDRWLIPGWYRVDLDGRELYIVRTCPDQFACGTAAPIWMKGELPHVNEGITERTVCVRGLEEDECCKKNFGIRVKNCGSYYVYALNYTDSCDEAYCFGSRQCSSMVTSLNITSSNQKSEIQTSTMINNNQLNDPCVDHTLLPRTHYRGAGCQLNDVDKPVRDNHLTARWFKVLDDDGKPLDIPTYCVEPLSCGTVAPIWLNDSVTVPRYEIATKRACVRGIKLSECCSMTVNVIIKNCDTYNVYYLPTTDGNEQGYCFGNGKCRAYRNRETNDYTEKRLDGGTVVYVALGVIGWLVFVGLSVISYNVLALRKRKTFSTKVNVSENYSPVTTLQLINANKY